MRKDSDKKLGYKKATVSIYKWRLPNLEQTPYLTSDRIDAEFGILLLTVGCMYLQT